MNTTIFTITSSAALAELFSKAGDDTQLAEDDYGKSVLGTHAHLTSMPKYELLFEPYSSLAERCGMSGFSLKQSTETGRFYLWNVNMGGHYPQLELRPVKLEHLLNLELMYQYHKDWAYELGRNINLKPSYQI